MELGKILNILVSLVYLRITPQQFRSRV